MISAMKKEIINDGRPRDGESFSLEKDNTYYETEQATERLDTWYATAKERAFFDFIYSRLNGKLPGLTLEIAGGTGFHGALLQTYVQGEYRHSDYSAAMVDRARAKGLTSDVMDGLKLPFAGGEVDTLFNIGSSTLIGDALMRVDQLQEIARVVKPGGKTILVTGRLGYRNGHHCLDAADIQRVRELGFDDIKVYYWGILPGSLWKKGNPALYARIERIVSFFGLGLRKVIIAHKRKA